MSYFHVICFFTSSRDMYKNKADNIHMIMLTTRIQTSSVFADIFKHVMLKSKKILCNKKIKEKKMHNRTFTLGQVQYFFF